MINEQEHIYVTRHFSFFSSLPLGMCVLRNDFTVLAWNNRLSHWTGLSANEIIGNDLRNFFPDFNTPECLRKLDSIFYGTYGTDPAVFSNDSSCPFFMNTKNQAVHFLSTTVHAVPDYDNRAFYAVISVQDATEGQNLMNDTNMDESTPHKNIEKLTQKNKLLQGILSATPIATILVENQVVKWGNDAAKQLFGYDQEDNYADLDTRDFYASNAWYYAVSETVIRMAPTKKLIETDAEFKKRNGDIFTGHLMVTCFEPENPLEKTIATISDLTARIQAEQIRLHREKLMSILDLAGAVCHELNQPLMAISGYAELMLMNIEKDHPHYGKLTKINDQIKKTGDITRKLMGITKYDANQFTNQDHAFSLSNLKVPRI